MDKATGESTDPRAVATPTGYFDGSPVAHINIWVEGDTKIGLSTHIKENGIQRVVEADETHGGTYVASTIAFGSGGVTIFIHREDLVRLVVASSEHLDALDRADTTDRKVASK